MKKLLAILLALAMIFSMSITAFADDGGGSGGDDIIGGGPGGQTPAPATTGSITITNATIGKTYTLYKIFDATYSDTSKGKAVAYTIEATIPATVDGEPEVPNPVFVALFGADGSTSNAYFNYNATTKAVTKKDDVVDTDLIDHLTGMVKNSENDIQHLSRITATDATVVFNDLPLGYYIILSDSGSAVTISSNTPDVEVIDKNQEPGAHFKKQVASSKPSGQPETYSTSNTASIGDIIHYQVSFEATNYTGAHAIQYYQVHDVKGDGIWVDFTSVKVSYENAAGEKTELERGYYLDLTGEESVDRPWEELGTWPNDMEKKPDNAQWYLVHLGLDQFRITIPWQDDYTLTWDTTNNVYDLEFGDDRSSMYPSPVTVYVTYEAAVEANATIGHGSDTNLFNKAELSWTCSHETHGTDGSEVVTRVYGVGLLKDDGTTYENLAGAKFRLYRDTTPASPIYVVPTNIDGVYKIDNAPGNLTDAAYGGMITPREAVKAERLEAYLGDKTEDNLVVSQVNGKLVVLGLEAGDYYLEEVEAPDGYNALTSPVRFTVNDANIKTFNVFANEADGTVIDKQSATATHTEHSYKVTDLTVHNSKGVELPSTGGTGTVMLIGIGSVIALAFAVLMITQKKMSIYRD